SDRRRPGSPACPGPLEHIRARWILSRHMLNGQPLVAGKRLHRPITAEAADAGILFAAEWIIGKIVDGLIVYLRHARLEPLGERRRTLHVLAEHAAGGSEGGLVREAQRLLLVLGRDDRCNRTEDFLACDQHVVPDVS